MSFKILEYILAIADSGSITKASEQLFISQSGLNQQLLKLEKEIGTPLFYRSKKEMIPTQAGIIYIENARKILKLSQNCITQINDLSDNSSGTILFGLPYEHGADLYIDISNKFSKSYPNVSIKLLEQNVKEMEEKIRTDQMDIAFIMRADMPSANFFNYIHLTTERLVLGIPKRHPLAHLASPPGMPLSTIELKRFKNDKFSLMFPGSTMREIIDPLFEHAGFIPDIRCETHMNNILYRLVSKGLSCTIIPQSYARNNNSCCWFYLDSNPQWNWYIIFNKTRVLGAADKFLIQLAQDYSYDMKKHWEAYNVGSPIAP